MSIFTRYSKIQKYKREIKRLKKIIDDRQCLEEEIRELQMPKKIEK